jgi:Zn-dependent peptidase ImmA (M78 family)
VLSKRLKKMGLRFDTYLQYEKLKPGASANLGSKDGVTVNLKEAGLYLILYNTENRPQSRINWTITHEIAHALMGHREKNAATEREADHFTKLILCHPLVLLKYGVTERTGIQRLCGLSAQAAANRENELRRVDYINFNKWDLFIVELFAEDIAEASII